MKLPLSTPNGTLVPLHDRTLHLRQDGDGAVAVVFDGDDGAGVGRLETLVRDLLPQVRVVRYDRAGYGRSDPAPSVPTPDEAAQDLRTALAKAGVSGPFLLVGHGFGGAVSRCFARRYRSEVVGIVLIDVHPPGFASLAPASWRRGRRTATARLAALAFLEKIAVALSGNRSWGKRASDPLGHRKGFPVPSAVARYGETVLLEEWSAGVGARDLGDLPLIVLAGDPPGLTETSTAEAARTRESWHALQSDVAASSARGRYVPVEGAHVDLPAERPDLVASAVRELLAQASVRAASGRPGDAVVGPDASSSPPKPR